MKKLWLITFVCLVSAMCYYLVFEQWYLVSSTGLFVVLVLVFVSLSFYCSASETAFATAHTDKRIQAKLSDETEEIAVRYSNFEEIIREQGLKNLSKGQWKIYERIEKDNNRLQLKSASLDETSRAIYVGSFASISVFLNVALAAFLPIAMVAQTVPLLPIELYVPHPIITTSEIKFDLALATFDISGRKTLVFLASAFPILILGKVVPKEVGALFNMFFAYRLNWLARPLVAIFWVFPATMSGPLKLLRWLAARNQKT